MPLRLLSPGIDLLSADGGFTVLGDRASPRPVVLVSRELCAFERQRPAEGGERGLDAARRRAAAAAPFLDCGMLVRRDGDAWAVWWWDMARVRPALEGRFGRTLPLLLPWSLATPRGDGWRILRLDQGFEAQLWADGALLASTWSREPFDRRSWSMFTRLQRRTGAPVDPPAPVELPVSPDRVRAALLPRPGWRGGLAAAVAAAAAAMVLTIAWAGGQGLHHARLTAALPPPVVAPPPPKSLDRLRDWRATTAGSDPVATTAVALGALEANGVRATAWRARRDEVEVTVPLAALSRLDRIADDLTADGTFVRIRSRTDAAAGRIDLILTPAPDRPSRGG